MKLVKNVKSHWLPILFLFLGTFCWFGSLNVAFAAPPDPRAILVEVENFPAVQYVEGVVSIDEFLSVQPVQKRVYKNTGYGMVETIYTVPAGKMLIIEYASAQSTAAATYQIITEVNGDSIQHVIGILAPEGGNDPRYTIGKPVKLYAGPSTNVKAAVTIQINSTLVTSANASISGRLVDAPQ